MGIRWSDYEVRIIRERTAAGDSPDVIAAAVGRTPNAVRLQAIRLRRRGLCGYRWPETCTAGDCDAPHYGWRLCERHYKKAKWARNRQ